MIIKCWINKKIHFFAGWDSDLNACWNDNPSKATKADGGDFRRLRKYGWMVFTG